MSDLARECIRIEEQLEADSFVTKFGVECDSCKAVRYCPYSKQIFVGKRAHAPLLVINEKGKCEPFTEQFFNQINSITFDSKHNIIILDRGKHEVVFIDRETRKVIPNQSLPNLKDPTAIAIDKDDTLYVASGAEIKIFRKNKDNAHDLNLPQYEQNGEILPVNFSWVYGICLNRDGNLIYSDYNTATLGIIDLKKKEVVVQLKLGNRSQLTDIAIDSYGNIVGGIWNHRGGKMRKFRLNEIGTEFSFQELYVHSSRKINDGYNSPSGVCFDADNNLYMAEADTGTIWKFASQVVSGIHWPPFCVLFASKKDPGSTINQDSEGISEITNLIILSLATLCFG
jgi:sugar lactone lactonase YvrE